MTPATGEAIVIVEPHPSVCALAAPKTSRNSPPTESTAPGMSSFGRFGSAEFVISARPPIMATTAKTTLTNMVHRQFT
jgi:hypothetical protein